MTYFPVSSPFAVFTDTDGAPLEDGYIYIGVANQNPIVNPITIYWSNSDLYPAAQPVRTIGGFPSRSGSPANIYVNAGAFEDYSILVQNKKQEQIYYAKSARAMFDFIGGNSVDLISDLRDISGYDQPIYVRGHSVIADGGGGTFEWIDGASPGTYIDDNGLTIVPTGGDGSGAWKRSHNGIISTRMFGLESNTDITIAFQDILDRLKGDDDTGENRLIYGLYVNPPNAGETYYISDTLVIDGTYGCRIFSDSPLSKRIGSDGYLFTWTSTNQLPVFQIKGGAGTPSNPNFLIKIENIGILGRDSYNVTASTSVALSGIYLGALDGDSQSTLNRMVTIENCFISNCRFGIYSGSPTGNNTDHANIILNNCFITMNYQTGIWSGTGNTITQINNCHVTNNGHSSATYAADNYANQKGANVYCHSGQIQISNYVSAGSGTNQPDNADIYQENGSIGINQAWSDTHGYFFYQVSATLNDSGYQTSSITGVRHFEGSMDITNTPDSMRIIAPGTIITACNLYGNIDVASGLSGKPVFSGINFSRSGAGFIGTGINTQRSLINIGNNGNYAQVLIGGKDSGGNLSHIGRLVPQFLSIGATQTGAPVSILQALGSALTDSGFTLSINPANGTIDIYINCYVYDSSFNFRAIKIGPGYIVSIGGPGNGALKLRVYEFTDTTTSISSSSFTDLGGIICGGATGYRAEGLLLPPKRSADPTFSSGDYWEGGFYYNTTTNKHRANTGGTTWVDMY